VAVPSSVFLSSLFPSSLLEYRTTVPGEYGWSIARSRTQFPQPPGILPPSFFFFSRREPCPPPTSKLTKCELEKLPLSRGDYLRRTPGGERQDALIRGPARSPPSFPLFPRRGNYTRWCALPLGCSHFNSWGETKEGVVRFYSPPSSPLLLI